VEAHTVFEFVRLLTVSVDLALARIANSAVTDRGAGIHPSGLPRAGERLITAATITLGISFLGPSIDAVLEIAESANPGGNKARWRPEVVAATQVALLLTAATAGVFEPGGLAMAVSRSPAARRPPDVMPHRIGTENRQEHSRLIDWSRRGARSASRMCSIGPSAYLMRTETGVRAARGTPSAR
jgi:hypothetical protein